MEDPDAEIPQEKFAVISHTAESVRRLVASPRVERDGRYPRVVAVAPGDDGPFGEGPDRHEVVLTSRQHVLAVR